MRAIVKLDAALVRTALGLKPGAGNWEIVPGFYGVRVDANETPTEEPLEPNCKTEFTYGPFKTGAYGATFQLSPELSAFADVIGPAFLSPNFEGTVTVRIRAVKRTDLRALGVTATLHVVD